MFSINLKAQAHLHRLKIDNLLHKNSLEKIVEYYKAMANLG